MLERFRKVKHQGEREMSGLGQPLEQGIQDVKSEETTALAGEHSCLEHGADTPLSRQQTDGGRGCVPIGAATYRAGWVLPESLVQAIDEVVERRITLLVGAPSTPLQPFKGFIHHGVTS
jgi:hypothetical protein